MSLINSPTLKPQSFSPKVISVLRAREATYAEDNILHVFTGENGVGGYTSNCRVSLKFVDGSMASGFLVLQSATLKSPIELIWKSDASIASDERKQAEAASHLLSCHDAKTRQIVANLFAGHYNVDASSIKVMLSWPGHNRKSPLVCQAAVIVPGWPTFSGTIIVFEDDHGQPTTVNFEPSGSNG